MYLNIGCGDRFHRDWENIDLVPVSPAVKKVNIIESLPYPKCKFQAVFCSHVLEHLDNQEVSVFIKEIFRVLKPNGIFRLLVPNLEQIVRIYIEKLESLKNGDMSVEHDYEWIVLEMFDQMVRQNSGGNMWNFLVDKHTTNKDFIYSRIGLEAEKIWNFKPAMKPQKRKKTFKERKVDIAKWIVRRLLGKEYVKFFEDGIFRNSGEIHRWMYDVFSLKRLLGKAGFESIRHCQPNESRVPDFPDFQLEVINGKIAKPDSLIMEALKPN